MFQAHENQNALPIFFENMIARLLAKDNRVSGKPLTTSCIENSLFADELKKRAETEDLRQLGLI